MSKTEIVHELSGLEVQLPYKFVLTMGSSTSGVWEIAEASGSAHLRNPKTSPMRRVRSQSAQESRLGASSGQGGCSENARQRAI